MNRSKNIVISILSSCLLFSSTGLSSAETISADPMAVDRFSSILDEGKLNKAKRLYDEILTKYNSLCVQLKNATGALKEYGISVDDAEYVYKVIWLLPNDVRLDCGLLRVVLSTLPELKNETMLKFMLKNHNSQEGQQRLGNLLVDLRQFVEVKNRAGVKEKITWEKYLQNQYTIKISRLDCDEMLSTLEAGNNLMINIGPELAYLVLNSCSKLKCFSGASLGLEKLLTVLLRYPQQENTVCKYLEKALHDAIIYHKRLLYLEPHVDGNKNMNDYDKEQRGVLKRMVDLATFQDTSDKGKADRALDNYVSVLTKVYKQIESWK